MLFYVGVLNRSATSPVLMLKMNIYRLIKGAESNGTHFFPEILALIQGRWQNEKVLMSDLICPHFSGIIWPGNNPEITKKNHFDQDFAFRPDSLKNLS